jgi:hypothetical protein
VLKVKEFYRLSFDVSIICRKRGATLAMWIMKEVLSANIFCDSPTPNLI